MIEDMGTLYSVTFLTFLISYLDYSRTYKFAIPIARSWYLQTTRSPSSDSIAKRESDW